MYQVRQYVISKTSYPEWFDYFDSQAHLACNLYNAALYRIRQIFTGWDKTVRSDHETEIFNEINLLEKTYPSVKVKRVVSYSHLDKLMRVTGNPDYFAGLPMQTAQAVIKQAVQDFKNWLASLRSYKKDPSGYTGRPGMPRYKKSGGTATYNITNQDAVIYPDGLKLPLVKKDRLDIGRKTDGLTLKECKVRPYYGRYLLLLTFECSDQKVDTDMPNMASIDFGTHNIAALVCTDGSSRLYKGGAIISENRRFAMNRARSISVLTMGHKTDYCPQTRHLDNLSFHHANFNRDQCHKISTDIVRWCLKHRAGILVLGVNKAMKQNIGLGAANNQLVYNVPLYMLRQMITYKALLYGIDVIEQEESYTSRADCTAFDYIPVYGRDDNSAVFSGRRISRGLYATSSGMIVNADLNGAANILRKAVPDAWDGVSDWYFLQSPEVSGFHELNPQSIPVKRIVAA